MTSLWYTSSYDNTYNFTEIGLIGGESKDLIFNAYDASGSILVDNLYGFIGTWRLYHLEESLDNPVLTKTVYPSGDTTLTVSIVSENTTSLSGTFVQEFIITDWGGKPYSVGKGLMVIVPSL